MGWLIVLIVVALALAPLLHFAPTPRQRAQARMREAAAVGGLFVEFRDLPGGARLSAADRQVLYYGARLPPSRQSRRGASWRREAGGWQALPGAPRGVWAEPPEPPEGVLAASVDEASCGFYWREEGGVERAGEVAEAVLAWRSTLAAAPGASA